MNNEKSSPSQQHVPTAASKNKPTVELGGANTSAKREADKLKKTRGELESGADVADTSVRDSLI